MDTDEFVSINHLQPVTSPVLLQRGAVPHPDGLVSTRIFGVTPKDRKTTWSYIDLGHVFFHPHIYKIICRFFRNVEKIVNGTSYYVINSEGHLVLSDSINGETGIQFLYDNWEKIKWEYTDSIDRNERIDIVSHSKKSEIFMSKQVVIPAFYRDVTSSAGGGGQVQEINTFYSNLIRLSSILKENDLFNFSLYSSQAAIQNLIVDIYNYFKEKLESKNGLLRKYLLGKNVDQCTRTVITAASYHANKPEDLQINLRYTGIPISQVLSLCKPFVMNWLNQFFEREVFSNKDQMQVIDPKTGNLVGLTEAQNPEFIFTDKYLQTRMNAFIKNPETRFDPIQIPMSDGSVRYMTFHGSRFNLGSKDELSPLMTRKLTWTDIFFMACDDVIKDKHVLCTRYPLLDQYGVFISKITVTSTNKTMPMIVGEKIYKNYPVVDLTVPKSRIPSMFIDSTSFSNSYLPGLDGD